MALQIPDLETLGQAFNTIQVEVGKVANHSAWNNGAMINNQLNQVLAQLNGYALMSTGYALMSMPYVQMSTL